MADYPILKDQISAAWLTQLAALLHQQHPAFPLDAFANLPHQPDFIDAGLKQRIKLVSDQVWQQLQLDFASAMQLLMPLSPQLKGLPALCLPQLVQDYGMQHPAQAMQALAVFTRDSTAEFAIRPFLQAEPQATLQQLLLWSQHPDEHLRRLASEGSRPRLPWGQALPLFKREPWHTWPILQNLLQDPSLYVRRSVANHCNDISKDHPDWLLDRLESLYGTHPHTDWIIKHALRDLLKKRHPRALALFNLAPLAVNAQIELLTPTVAYGNTLQFVAQLTFVEPAPQLRLEFAIDFVGANGQWRHKVFQWLKRRDAQGTLRLPKQYRFVDLTTRTHYAGVHRLSLIVNGQLVSSAEFTLINDKATAG
ncbi:MAG TPA: hypothetical protein DCS87_10565 [Rheinheimera sp.]|nr:hypothetical protein [Rheinheimera sp.]